MSCLKDAVHDLLLDRTATVQQAADRHFAPGFRQRTNGRWDDREAFVARLAGLRESVQQATFTVLDEVTAGRRYAERHVIELVLTGGERIHQEVYVFAERDDDGRFLRIEEATVALGDT